MRNDFINNNYFIDDYKNDKYTKIIDKDYYIYKDPVLGKKDIYYYNNDNYTIGSYGNIVDSLISTLTPYELEKLRVLAMSIKGQGISSLSNNDLLSLVRIVTDPQYDSSIRNLGIRVNRIKGNTPNPATVPVTPPIQPITVDIQTTKVEEAKPEVKEEPKRANPLVEKFLSDIRSKQGNASFRGWMLPNGQLLSQYVDDSNGMISRTRQDHAKLYKLFMAGLEIYDKASFDKINELYEKYVRDHGITNTRVYDWDESFAVEALGWMQIAVNGGGRILYRGEGWQNRLLRPFQYDYGFNFEISDFGDVYYVEFMHLYDNIDEILSLGLEQKYERH